MRLGRTEIRDILDRSLAEKEFFSPGSLKLLAGFGFSRDEALAALAAHRSKAKYGYDLSHETIFHLLQLSRLRKDETALHHLVESPFFLMKAGWLYEHAPYFLLYGKNRPEDMDAFIVRFASQYDSLLLKGEISTAHWERLKEPWRILGVTFWENQVFDPIALLDRVRQDHFEGLELSIDFHPFNPKRLLPEELSQEKRREIRQACARTGLKIDIHSPIVGPYSPSPDPKKGTQLFYDPLGCFDLQCETIELAKDIGAGCVVLHLINTSNLRRMADLIMKAGGSKLRVTMENYCQTPDLQSSEAFIDCANEILHFLPKEVRSRNFGLTLDVGHLNIEGEDPLVGAERVGRWCVDNGVFMRLHATDNYGKLLYSPPAFSADVHGNVSGRGINNAVIIKLLRSMGLRFDVVAEQILPLSQDDITALHGAQTMPFHGTCDDYVRKGKDGLSGARSEALVTPSVAREKAYLFLAGMEGVTSLKEHLVYRRIQDKKHLSVDEARKISQEFMRMPQKQRIDLIDYMDELLLPVQSERGLLQKSELDLICNNISGALFGTINNEHLDQIFADTRLYHRGQVICEQDTVGRELYYIKEGEVAVFVGDSLLATLRPGEIFGEISLFYNVRRTATIKAATGSTRVGVLTRDGFEALLRNSEPFTYDLIYRLYNILPERLRNLNDKYKRATDALRLFMEDHKKLRSWEGDFLSRIVPQSDLLPVFQEEEAREVFRETLHFREGQVLFAEGDTADGAYLLLEGRVKVAAFTETLEEIMLGEISEGEIFGEMALIDDRPRSASIIALTPCRVAFVDKKAFHEYIQTGTALSFQLMAYICLSLFKRILTLDRVYADIKKSLS